MDGFGKGFFGCFGVLAAIGVCLLLLVMCSSGAGGVDEGAQRIAAGEALPGDYTAVCVAGVVEARRPGLEYAAGADPVIVRAGTPARVGCPAVQADGTGAAVYITVHCAQYLEDGCVSVDRVVAP